MKYIDFDNLEKYDSLIRKYNNSSSPVRHLNCYFRVVPMCEWANETRKSPS